ncbi:MAG: terminase family protein [Bacillota bacterium]|nr:terminase family protein [Bacillota bacterium]
MARFEDEALYGGAAGGGKSDALLAEALRQVNIPHYRGIIFRKTYPECSGLIDRSLELYSLAYPDAKYNGNNHCWTFPSGAKIYFGSMQHRQDRLKYQGKRYDFIGFDELTHFTWDEYSYMFSRNRPGGEGTKCYIRATCNPGGIGHAWVKERFIAGKEPMRTYYETVNVNGKEYSKSRIFVPSTVFDNKILLEQDPNYVASLSMLPEQEKKALLYGDWNSFSGQVFTEFRDNPDGYDNRKYTHVIKPFKIPKEWKRYRSFDFGYSRPFSVGWWAVDFDGRAYRYRELYGSTGEPNVGLRWEPKKMAEKIREIEDKYDEGNMITGIADPAIWDSSRGIEGSIINLMESERLFFDKGNNSRIAGKMQVHYRLAFDENGYPMMYVFNTCKDFIRTIPALVYDELDIEDVNTQGEDHIYDDTRYFLMSDPIKPTQKGIVDSPIYNPLK